VTGKRSKPRILVVEDQESMRVALAAALGAGDYEVRTEADGAAIDAVMASFRPHLAILDVRLPVGPDGYALARRLREAGDLPIIFVTGADAHDARKEGFAAGADDYVLKPFSLEELMWRVTALLRRSGRLAAPLEIGDLTVDEGAGMATRAGKVLALTATEHRLLCVLARHAGQVLSKAQLLRQVWNHQFADDNLVEVHVSSLRHKLEAHGPRTIHTVRGAGYVMRPATVAERNPGAPANRVET